MAYSILISRHIVEIYRTVCVTHITVVTGRCELIKSVLGDQDASFPDPNAIRLLLTAEMLKPSSPCYDGSSSPSSSSGSGGSEETGPIVEHLPEMVVVHNRARLEDFSADRIEKMARSVDILRVSLSMTHSHEHKIL